MNKLKLYIHHPKEVMFVSDRAGGLLVAFNEVFERPLHFFCLYHLMQNLRNMYKAKRYTDVWKNVLCKYLKEAAYAPNIRAFDVAIKKFILKGGKTAEHFLKELPYEKWAVAFAPDIHR